MIVGLSIVVFLAAANLAGGHHWWALFALIVGMCIAWSRHE